MANNDGAGKSGDARAKPGSDAPLRHGGDSAPKKPAALLDLKATEVQVREVKSAAAPVQPAASAAASGPLAPPPAQPYDHPAAKDWGPAKASGLSAASFIKPADPAAQSEAQSSSKTAEKAVGEKAVGEKAVGGAGKAAPPPPRSEPRSQTDAKAAAQAAEPRAPTSGGGLRAAATHMAAGLAGGLLALLGADAIGPTLGLPQTVSAEFTADISRRLRAVEDGGGRAATVSPEQSQAVAQKLAATETRLGQIDEMAKTLAALKDQQSKLSADAKDVSDKLAQARPDGGAEARLAKLEDVLSTLSTAAVGDPQRGRIPQLATITGRLADLESNLNTQLAALRRSVTQEVDSRLARSTEASEAARSGAQRLDRELATVKTEAAQLASRIEGVKSATDRTEIVAGDLKTAVDGIKGDLSRELKQVARPGDLDKAVSPVVTRLTALEENVQGVVRGEDDRRANAERIVLALELGNLKRTVERGAPFAAELGEVRRVGVARYEKGGLDLSALERQKNIGVPTVTDLAREFRTIAHSMIDAETAPAEGTWTDRLVAGAKSIVRVRRVDHAPEETGIEATVARIESDLKDGKLAEVATAAAKLSAKTLAPARDWLDKVAARAAVERAIKAIDGELKSSLGAGARQSPNLGKKG